MISYAQNAEDVVLARVLPAETGFYVDIGASSPDASSVTRHFYEKGWRGINVEPRRDAWDELKRRRPEDLNLQVAIGSQAGVMTLYYVEQDPDLSTIDADDLAYITARGYSYRAEEVQVRTMSSVLELAGVSTIDFLKIDAEGAEEAVLAGLDLRRWRPTVIVVEAIRPWSTERTDTAWRRLLESSGYREGLFDGVNLFFAPEEAPEVLAGLVPASALDQYRTAEVDALQQELDRHRTRMGGSPQRQRRHLPPLSAPPPTRFAVVGSPHSGHGWIAGVLGRALDADVGHWGHPGEIPWRELPGRVVMTLPWGRTAELERRFRDAGVRAISPARHPLDVLSKSYGRLRGNGPPQPPGGEDFTSWARSPEARRLVALTAGWWSTPATIRVRYEDLVGDPDAGFRALMQRARVPVPPGPVLSGPRPAAPVGALDGEDRRVLLDAYRDELKVLGYPVVVP